MKQKRQGISPHITLGLGSSSAYDHSSFYIQEYVHAFRLTNSRERSFPPPTLKRFASDFIVVEIDSSGRILSTPLSTLIPPKRESRYVFLSKSQTTRFTPKKSLVCHTKRYSGPFSKRIEKENPSSTTDLIQDSYEAPVVNHFAETCNSFSAIFFFIMRKKGGSLVSDQNSKHYQNRTICLSPSLIWSTINNSYKKYTEKFKPIPFQKLVEGVSMGDQNFMRTFFFLPPIHIECKTYSTENAESGRKKLDTFPTNKKRPFQKKIISQKKSVVKNYETSQRYTQFLLTKYNLETFTVINSLQFFLNCRKDDISHAGIKDKIALTCQRFRVRGLLPKEKILSLNKKQSRSGLGVKKWIHVSDVTYVSSPLHMGELWGNRFRILLRDIPETCRNIVNKPELFHTVLQEWRNRGFFNYYGAQRFGVEGKWYPIAVVIKKTPVSPFL